MEARIVRAGEVPGLDERWNELTAGVWPEYNVHGDVSSALFGRLGQAFPEFQFVCLDADSGEIAARGYTIPCVWDGTPDGLPPGFDGLLEQAYALREADGAADTLSALAIAVTPAYQGRGLSRRMIAAMVALAREHRLRALIAPLRPVWKDRYPLAPIERYCRWTAEDGRPFDPWIRTHVELGAVILRPEPRSLRITGSVGEWEEWTGMRFPESGTYVFPQGLAPLEIDVEADVGRYWEPNVWVGHDV